MTTSTAFIFVGSEEFAGAGEQWSLGGSIVANDSSWRTASFTALSDSTKELRGFNLSIAADPNAPPDNAVIKGVEVGIGRHYTEQTPTGDVRDTAVRLLKDDGAGGRMVVGQVRVMPGAWKKDPPDAFDVVGGPTDDWGAALIGADVKSPNFGASLICHGRQDILDLGDYQTTANVNYITLRVTWDLPTTTQRLRRRTRSALARGVLI